MVGRELQIAATFGGTGREVDSIAGMVHRAVERIHDERRQRHEDIGSLRCQRPHQGDGRISLHCNEPRWLRHVERLKSSVKDTRCGKCRNIPELSSHAMEQTIPNHLEAQSRREDVNDLVLHDRCCWVDTEGMSQVIDRHARQGRHGARE